MAASSRGLEGPGSEPHSVSLKVLRLSRPTLFSSNVLPDTEGAENANLRAASLVDPTQAQDAFSLTPHLTLPAAFGAAYVGQTFACTLCANNELPSTSPLLVRDVRLMAEPQVPSRAAQGGTTAAVGLDVQVRRDSGMDGDTDELEKGATMQGIVRCELREEGPHVLAVTVGYTEVLPEGERKRSFRKLYQFAAQQAVGVRTKVSEMRRSGEERRFVLEAQVENLTEKTLVLDRVRMEPLNGVQGQELAAFREIQDAMLLSPGDVQQVAFVLERASGHEVRVEQGRALLARLRVDWRMTMGQNGTLMTGWLGYAQK